MNSNTTTEELQRERIRYLEKLNENQEQSLVSLQKELARYESRERAQRQFLIKLWVITRQGWFTNKLATRIYEFVKEFYRG